MALTGGYSLHFLRQPSGLVRINEKHWLARDLIFAHTGLQAFAFGRPIAPAIEAERSVQFATASGGNDGLQHSFGLTPNGSLFERYALGALVGLPVTLVAWSRPGNNTAEQPLLTLRAGATTEAVELQSSTLELTTARARTSANASNAATATGTATANAWQQNVAVFISSASRRAYFNGGGEGTAATSRVVNSVLDTVEVFRSGADAVAASTLGGIALPIIISRALAADEIARLYAEQFSDPWALFAGRRIWAQISAGGGASTAALATTGASGTFSATANSTTTATLSATGNAGTFAGSAFTSATATLAATGGAGIFAGSASTSASASLAVTGNSGAFSGSATAPASVALAALGGEGAFAGSAFPLTSAEVAALGASGAFSGSASTVGTAELAATGSAGAFSGSANSATIVEVLATGGAGTFSGSASVASGTAGAAEVWNYVLSNGQTAEENVIAIRALLTDLHRIHGLELGLPLVVTATARTAGAITQALSEVAGTVTVERQ